MLFRTSRNILVRKIILPLGLMCGVMCLSLVSQPMLQKRLTDFEKAKKTFAHKYPVAGKVSWEVDSHGNHEAQFKLDGRSYRADFLPNGKWIETERSIKWSELPKAVQEHVEDEFDKDDISEIEWVDHHSKGEFYDVEFKRKGKNLDVALRANGHRIMGKTTTF